MASQDYEDEQQDSTPEDPASLKGKGWDVLAGGKQNPYELGGEDPFDLQTPPTSGPYTEDDEADWIITGGLKARAEEPASEAGAPSLYAPRDVTADELAHMTSSQLGAMDMGTGPLSEPESPASPETSALPREDWPLPVEPPATAGISPGVHVVPAGEEQTLPPSSPFTPPLGTPSYVPSVGPEGVYPVTPAPVLPGEGALSPGVSVTPLGPDGQPITAHEPPAVSPVQPSIPPGGPLAPGGGPISLPDQPLVIPPTMPSVPDRPPWPIPQPQGLPQGGFFISDPFSDEKSKLPIPGEELLPDEQLRTMLVTPERVQALWDEIDETFDLIINDVRGHYGTTEQAIADLKEARELLLAGTQYYDNAEQLVYQVKARLRLEEKVRQWSRSRGTWLGVYLVVWLLALSATSLLTNRVGVESQTYVPAWLAATWLPGLFGGLGGVVGALWVLIKHIAVKRDFDPIHTPWYVLNPFMGVAMGVVTYFVILVSGNTLLNLANSGVSLDLVDSPFSPVLYLLCIVVGFNQNVLWSLIDRIVDTLFPRPAEDSSAATDIAERADRGTPSEPRGPQG